MKPYERKNLRAAVQHLERSLHFLDKAKKPDLLFDAFDLLGDEYATLDFLNFIEKYKDAKGYFNKAEFTSDYANYKKQKATIMKKKDKCFKEAMRMFDKRVK